MQLCNQLTPTSEDVLSAKPKYIPTNLVGESYDSLNHYAEVQYQLLWEDFLYSLRDGISLLKKYLQTGGKKWKEEAGKSVVYYANVQLQKTEGAKLYLVFPKSNKNSNKDKTLTSGSLLYLSDNKFNSITTGIIENDSEDQVVIVRLRDIENIKLQPGAKFDVVENKSYFRAYEPYLNCLNLMTNWHSLSLIDYILGIDCEVRLPNYIDVMFQFRDRNTRWYRADDVGLNEGQRKALHLAMTNNIAIIQGPPGTGKTFLGVKIVETLLMNRTYWGKLGPILLVCFTNHALDQFLEKIVDKIGLKPSEVVRFGSRSENEKLDSYNIVPLRQSRRIRSDLRIFYTEREHIEGLQKDAMKVFVRQQTHANRREVQRLMKMYEDNEVQMAKERAARDKVLLSATLIVGMTTTGAALNRELLDLIQPGIVIVEEAAEVTESHVVTALSENCRHLILIGDHKQLRPHTSCHELARNNGTEISFFERMIENGLPYATLTLQHRMRPKIAELLVPNIYEQLDSHRDVYEYEEIKGIESSVFFVDHKFDFLDKKPDKSTSFVNEEEAKFAIALCRYLLTQGYPPSEITILSAYKGQMQLLQKLAVKNAALKDVLITSIDNYQGEENDIIILSLVRSNFESQAGFLTIENRVCVALSRARKGLYAIGNFKMLSNVRVWQPIIKSMRKDNLIGPILRVFCENHPKVKYNVRVAKDFDKVPKGDCGLPCEYVYPVCGHRCQRLCHHVDVEHVKACTMKCSRKCSQGHQCEKPCRVPCGPCILPVQKVHPVCSHLVTLSCRDYTLGNFFKVMCESMVTVRLDCGHLNTALCYKVKKGLECSEPCSKKCSEGHQCEKLCKEPCGPCILPVQRAHPVCSHLVTLSCQDYTLGDFSMVMCESMVTVTGDCGHLNTVPCYKGKNGLVCSEPCPVTLPCGHRCQGTCDICSTHDGIQVHQLCSEKCCKLLLCGHHCQLPCSDECLRCVGTCGLSCSHQTCELACDATCVPCTKPCTWVCPHYSCTKLCYEPCNRPRCNQPCPKLLPCSHLCLGLCGEPCPQSCRQCNPEDFTQYPYLFSFVQLTDCGHLVPVDELDGLMGVSRESVGFMRCPQCQACVRNSVRYGNEVKETRKLLVKIRGQLRDSFVKLNDYKMAAVTSSRAKHALMVQIEKCSVVMERVSMKDTDLITWRKITQLVGPLCSNVKHVQVADALDALSLWMNTRQLRTQQFGFNRLRLQELYLRINRVRLMKQLLIIRGKKDSSLDEALEAYRNIADEPSHPFDKEVLGELEKTVRQLAKKSKLAKKGDFLQGPSVLFTWNSDGWKKCDAGHAYQSKTGDEPGECPECNAKWSLCKRCIVQ